MHSGVESVGVWPLYRQHPVDDIVTVEMDGEAHEIAVTWYPEP